MIAGKYIDYYLYKNSSGVIRYAPLEKKLGYLLQKIKKKKKKERINLKKSVKMYCANYILKHNAIPA